MSVFDFDSEPVISEPESDAPVGLEKAEEDIPEHDPRLVGIAGEIKEVEDQITEISAGIFDAEEEQKRISAEMRRIREEAQAKIDELNTRHFEIEKNLREIRAERRRLEIRLRDLQRKFQVIMDAISNEKRFLSYAEEAEEKAKEFYWRQFILDHQLDGAKHLAMVKRGILGDKRGLGKSLTSIAYCDLIGAKRILYVLPADVIKNMEREIAHWAPHRQVFSMGKIGKNERKFTLKLLNTLDEFVVTINYQAWRKDDTLIPDMIDLQFDTVICDEAHEMKTASTSAFKGVKRLVHAENSCPRCMLVGEVSKIESAKTDHGTNIIRCVNCDWDSRADDVYDFGAKCSVRNVLPMTGTAILNKPQDLFPLLNLVDPVKFHQERDFLNSFCIQYGPKWRFTSGGEERLVRELGGKFIVRDRYSAGVVWPEQQIIEHDIDFDTDLYPRQWEVIKQLSENAAILVNDRALPILYQIALITRQRQANVWPGGIELHDEKGDLIWRAADDITESLKIDKAVDMAEEIVENGDRLVVFSQFKTALAETEIRMRDKGLRVVRLDGDTHEKTRELIKMDFDRRTTDPKDARWDIVLCNFKTGGVGLNFTGASEMIIMDEEWNPGKNDQAYGRIDRLGQTKETTVHVFRINNTIDRWMKALNDEKAKMIQGLESEIDMQDILKRLMEEDGFNGQS